MQTIGMRSREKFYCHECLYYWQVRTIQARLSVNLDPQTSCCLLLCKSSRNLWVWGASSTLRPLGSQNICRSIWGISVCVVILNLYRSNARLDAGLNIELAQPGWTSRLGENWTRKPRNSTVNIYSQENCTIFGRPSPSPYGEYNSGLMPRKISKTTVRCLSDYSLKVGLRSRRSKLRTTRKISCCIERKIFQKKPNSRLV